MAVSLRGSVVVAARSPWLMGWRSGMGRMFVLRKDGGSWHLGYPRVVEPVPGTLLSVYNMNTRDDPIR